MAEPEEIERRPQDFTADLVRWSETLAAIARTGLGFTENLYEQERFEEVLHVAADIKAAANEALEAIETEQEQVHFVQEWMESVGVGVPGYVTPKVAIGAIVGNDRNEILLVQRADSGIWLYPTGWADVGYSPAEVAVKEVGEETGIECVPERLLAVIDGQRMGFSRFGMYMLLFHCTALGGDLKPHPLETSNVGWFAHDRLPGATAGAQWWGPMAFAAISGEDLPVHFDPVRSPIWRS
ncbi:MAG: NUDIX hydrolase N-terminal domain-containing protein [Actinomycetota bacterium]|nr:NUDIX hydrolase N-terminal domain-containing protein [Actinomycetota bacterium]